MPFGSSQWMYSSGFYPTEIDQSLKFDSTSSTYLSKFPATTGNRKTWTQSTWIKRGKIGSYGQNCRFWASSDNASGDYLLAFTTTDALTLYDQNASFTTNAVYRDTSAWYHLVLAIDTTQATASNRMKVWINGEQITSFSAITYPSLNGDLNYNRTGWWHALGAYFSSYPTGGQHFDGYLADTYFVDGTALDPTSFGEFKSGVWIPKAYEGSYGTNGFHLTYQDDTVSEGFNTVTYTATRTPQSISGVGFSPDFIWVKDRGGLQSHALFDTVRGVYKQLRSDTIGAELTSWTNNLVAFDNDGFSLGADTSIGDVNYDTGKSHVAWCWDAGSSTVSNTAGTIPSSVRANPAYGFSIVSYTGNGTTGATIGHGLSATPSVLIVKPRSIADNWNVYHASNTAQPETDVLYLNLTNATSDNNTIWNDTAPTASVFSIGSNGGINTNASPYIAYCFSEIAGYSKFGSYTANTTTPPAITGLGFEPAFLMVKNTSRAEDWAIVDNTRDVGAPKTKYLAPNNSSAEVNSVDRVTFNSDGFTVNAPAGYTFNFQTGDTYIYMAFKDTRDLAFWRDQSGNGNDWQPNNLNYQDTVFDSPTNNYATLNPLQSTVAPTNGNLEIASGGGETCPKATIQLPLTGKWYWETYCTQTGTDNYIGVTTNAGGLTLSGTERSYRKTGIKSNNGVSTSYGATWASGDTLGVAVDMDAGSITFYKNNVSQGVAFTDLTGVNWSPYFYGYINAGHAANFGQSGFTYTPPDGFLALCTANLPEPSISPANGDSPQDYFNTVLYTGNGGTQTVSGVGFEPDFTWVKQRSGATSHWLNDAVRGAGLSLASNTTEEEKSYAAYFTAFNNDGFALAGGTGGFNNNASTYASWNWKASNATAVSNTAGTITSQVSANPTAGFSIVSYTGTGVNATVGHGLGVAPKMVIVKSRSVADAWAVYHGSLGATKYLLLNSTASADTASTLWNNTAPTSSVFSISTSGAVNTSSATLIAYCFADVEGYSKFGSYTGNGLADGTFVYTGFRPAWLLIKNTTTAGYYWCLLDNKRSPYNTEWQRLYPNDSLAEDTGQGNWDVDAVSNGFKLRGLNQNQNQSGSNYIYMAFAENPFKYANAR